MRIVKRDPEKGYLAELLWTPKSKIPVDSVKAALTFSVVDDRTMRFLTLYEETDHHLLIPREFWDLANMPLSFDIVDCLPRRFPTANIRSKIVLDYKNPRETTQREAVQAMEQARGGILQLACGRGKTVCALELIARENVPALIVVDNTQLLEQWKSAIQQFLDVPGGIGLIQGKEFDWDKDIVLATYTTVANRADTFPEAARLRFGVIIWDEGHHMAAPVWSRGATLFPGKRYALTATPERADGMHVVYDFHIGKVLYKDLRQELKPQIYFQWTGLEVDTSDPRIKQKVCDVNGELHTSMLASYFGQWRVRLDFILDEVRRAAAEGRKIIVLSYSIGELVNLLALWNGETYLYSDIPEPTPQDVGETFPPQQIDERNIRKLFARLNEIKHAEQDPRTDPKSLYSLRMHKADIETRLKQHEVWKKVQSELEKRQREYVKNLLTKPSTAGLMIAAVKAQDRTRMLREKQVTFAIMKYGREGLDEQSLDTIFVCEPMSQKNGLQQLMGRVLRIKAGKKQPIVVFFEDNIGPMIGMCQNLRGHLRAWSHEDGGPFDYTLVGHPRKGKGVLSWTAK